MLRTFMLDEESRDRYRDRVLYLVSTGDVSISETYAPVFETTSLYTALDGQVDKAMRAKAMETLWAHNVVVTCDENHRVLGVLAFQERLNDIAVIGCAVYSAQDKAAVLNALVQFFPNGCWCDFGMNGADFGTRHKDLCTVC